MSRHFVWNPDPEIVNLFGNLSLRWYSLLFVGGLILGYFVVKRMFKKDGRTQEELDQLAMYVFIGTVVGARLGHCLFYEPDYYLSHPLEMLLPISFGEGGIEFTGYQGLASHGGVLGVFLAIWYFCRKTKIPMLDILDKVATASGISACFIRLGNFFNSEILGHQTDSFMGIIFERVDDIPRHPAQLYEAFSYLLIFIIMNWLYESGKFKARPGFLFGFFFAMLFTARFFIEFFKIDQVPFESGMTLNMGQLLSIPFVLAGLWMMKRSGKTN